jgi:dTDP-4-amino-4,6-dideoxygalactose transaminase
MLLQERLKMAIFNSLGSNYRPGFIFNSLFGLSFEMASDRLVQELGDHYGGAVTLTYKGRQALELAMRKSGLPTGSKVAINGFTCYVVYQAVVNAGYEPVFIDVAKGQMNFGLEELKGHTDIKAIIIQNTLGFPCDMVALKSYCKTNNILLVEDLAHSIGATYGDGTEAGMVGDLAMLSFSQDKPLDVVAGGALIDRRTEAAAPEKLPAMNMLQRFKNRMYPFWSGLIRATYPLGIGRYIHAILKKTHALAIPMSDNLKGIQRMSPKAMVLLLTRWQGRNTEFAHRRTIAKIYQDLLPPDIQIVPLSGSNPLYLRFPLLVNDRPGLIGFLKQYKIYVGDTWYDAPIAPSRYLEKTTYKAGLCPNAEVLCASIVNLPTHINVSEKEAKRIAQKVNEWLSRQK